MVKFKYKVLLPTSGTGSRLGNITKNLNKALIPLNGRAAVAYIIDSYPENVPIVITLGFLGQSVKDFLEKNYPKRPFEFVWVDKYEGPGTSLGYSMLQAKNNLQCPFVFHACDGIFIEKIPTPTRNWIGGYVEDWKTSTLSLTHYRTHTMKDNKIIHFNEKGISRFDSLHIGLNGIFDYKLYWEILEDIYKRNPNDMQISDVPILGEMIKKGIEFDWKPFKIWLDTGNLQALSKTEKFMKNGLK
jgi:NDP-sugar pyrophosphorylase family protein